MRACMVQSFNMYKYIHNVPELITTKKNYNNNKTNESAYKINNLKLSSFFFFLLIIFIYIHYV